MHHPYLKGFKVEPFFEAKNPYLSHELSRTIFLRVHSTGISLQKSTLSRSYLVVHYQEHDLIKDAS